MVPTRGFGFRQEVRADQVSTAKTPMRTPCSCSGGPRRRHPQGVRPAAKAPKVRMIANALGTPTAEMIQCPPRRGPQGSPPLCVVRLAGTQARGQRATSSAPGRRSRRALRRGGLYSCCGSRSSRRSRRCRLACGRAYRDGSRSRAAMALGKQASGKARSGAGRGASNTRFSRRYRQGGSRERPQSFVTGKPAGAAHSNDGPRAGSSGHPKPIGMPLQ